MSDLGLSSREERIRAAARDDDVIRAVLLDHAEIKDLLAETLSAQDGDARRLAFARLVARLATHETAEEELIHPLTRRGDHAEAVVDERLAEEDRLKRALAELEAIGVDDPGFESRLRPVAAELEAHIDREEREELPVLERVAGPKTLRRLTRLFRAAERAAPTHPHPEASESALGNLILAPLAAVIDRTRDAIRKAEETSRTP
jgi:hemerythrin superfamily protein